MSNWLRDLDRGSWLNDLDRLIFSPTNISLPQYKEGNNFPIYTLSEGNFHMQTIKVKVAELITKLKENKVKHEAEYREAVLDYRRACKVQLERTLAKVKPEKAKIDIAKSVHTLRVVIDAPRCYLREYDRVILMMQMTSDTIIEISEADFRQYVMDEWNWKHDFSVMNQTYKSFSGSGVTSNEFVMPRRNLDVSAASQLAPEEDPDAIG